jgi:hypothetical protein
MKLRFIGHGVVEGELGLNEIWMNDIVFFYGWIVIGWSLWGFGGFL